MRPSPDAIVAAARRYLGTPYHHQAALAGAGCDCLGLVRGVWRDLYGAEPEKPPPYTPDWGETGDAEPMLDAARRHLVEMDVAAAGPGDVVLFRVRPEAIVKHAAILTGGGRIVHAVSRDRVREEAMGAWWARRAVAAFGWPERAEALHGVRASCRNEPPAPSSLEDFSVVYRISGTSLHPEESGPERQCRRTGVDRRDDPSCCPASDVIGG